MVLTGGSDLGLHFQGRPGCGLLLRYDVDVGQQRRGARRVDSGVPDRPLHRLGRTPRRLAGLARPRAQSRRDLHVEPGRHPRRLRPLPRTIAAGCGFLPVVDRGIGPSASAVPEPAGVPLLAWRWWPRPPHDAGAPLSGRARESHRLDQPPAPTRPTTRARRGSPNASLTSSSGRVRIGSTAAPVQPASASGSASRAWLPYVRAARGMHRSGRQGRAWAPLTSPPNRPTPPRCHP